MLGLCQPYTSHPFTPTTPEQDAAIEAILKRNGLL